MNKGNFRTAHFSDLKGQTLTDIKQGDDEIVMTTSEGRIYVMFHDQECCEYVYINDIAGEIKGLIGSPITLAEERAESGDVTWTFYEIATNQVAVTITWKGESNGFYSESVDFIELLKDEQ